VTYDLKDVITLVLSSLAFGLSVIATVRGERRASDEKRRTIRTQLTDVLARLTSLQLENAKLVHEAKGDQLFLQNVGTALNQQNGFLLDQAFYLSDQIPHLVTTYEFNTIANASFNASDALAAEKYHLKGIEVAHSDIYKAQATRGYAVFLFTQRRFVEGRAQFNKALALIKGDNNLTRQTNGFTYGVWAWNEQHLALAAEDAKNLYDKARAQYSAIDVDFVRDSMLQALEASQNAGLPTRPAAANLAPPGTPGVARP
jgi:hypothetical protein